ncbi:MAG: hypothetical protein ACK5QQ_03025, partial [Cyanobacteriota bacterium]
LCDASAAPLRAGDALHLAVCRRVRGSLATMDQGLAAAGQEAGLAVARLSRESDSDAESGDCVARRRRFHAHQPGLAGSAVELLRVLRDQEP